MLQLKTSRISKDNSEKSKILYWCLYLVIKLVSKLFKLQVQIVNMNFIQSKLNIITINYKLDLQLLTS